MRSVWIIAAAAAALGGLTAFNLGRMRARPKAQGGAAHRVKTEKLAIPAGGRTLYGELYLPCDAAGRLPAVICCHGFGSGFRKCRDSVGTSLAMSGLAVCCFDFYGGGPNSRSGGKMTEMSVFSERDDLNAVIEFIRALPSVDSEKLFLLGESQGGFVAAITAAERKEDVCGLILYYPAFCIADDAKRRYASAADVPDVYRIMGRQVGRVYSEKLYDFDVWEAVRGYEKPVLIVHGDADRIVSVSYAKKAAEVYEDAALHILPGEIHGFTGRGQEAAARLTYDFIVKGESR